MKGITHYYGKDQLQYLLLSSGGNSESSVAMADDCIERYGITVPLEAAEGTPIGNYLVHGTLRFMACDAERCLPPMELPWKAKVEVF